MYNIKIVQYYNGIFGEMWAFRTANGIWLLYDDVLKCLNLSQHSISWIYDKIPEDKKQIVDCDLNGYGKVGRKFIHQDQSYRLLLYCEDYRGDSFRDWIVDIASEMDYADFEDEELNTVFDDLNHENNLKDYIDNLPTVTFDDLVNKEELIMRLKGETDIENIIKQKEHDMYDIISKYNKDIQYDNFDTEHSLLLDEYEDEM